MEKVRLLGDRHMVLIVNAKLSVAREELVLLLRAGGTQESGSESSGGAAANCRARYTAGPIQTMVCTT